MQKNQKMHNVLILVDTQYDFIAKDGGLSVFRNGKNDFLQIDSNTYAERVGDFVLKSFNLFDAVVFSIDFHPPQHCSFKNNILDRIKQLKNQCLEFINELENNPLPFINKDICQKCPAAQIICQQIICDLKPGDVQALWSNHCVQGTNGVKLMPQIPFLGDLPIVVTDPKHKKPEWDPKPTTSIIQFENMYYSFVGYNGKTIVVYKGTDPKEDSYSAFFGNKGQPTGLGNELLKSYPPANTNVFVLGVAYDYCVKFTAKDAAVQLGYDVYLIDQLTAPVGHPSKPFEQVKIEIQEEINGALRSNNNKNIFKII